MIELIQIPPHLRSSDKIFVSFGSDAKAVADRAASIQQTAAAYVAKIQAKLSAVEEMRELLEIRYVEDTTAVEADSAFKVLVMAALAQAAKLRRELTDYVRQMWQAVETAHSQVVVKKKGTQQSASRGRGQGIRTWVSAIFESDLSTAKPESMNISSMPYAHGLVATGASSPAAVRSEQRHATSVASSVRAQARLNKTPTFSALA